MIVKEDGTGLPTANAYQDVSGATAVHAARGTIDAWQQVVDSGAAEGRLIDASQLLEPSPTAARAAGQRRGRASG